MTYSLALIPLLATGAFAQAVPKPSFEVASVKRSLDCRGPGGISRPVPGRVDLHCATLQSLIQYAFGIFGNGPSAKLERLQTTGGPPWMETDYFDISAKSADNAPIYQMYGPMLQSLLEERFQLKVHREDREMPVYVMTVAKGGSKLQPYKEGTCLIIDVNHLPAPAAPGEPPPTVCGVQQMRRTVESMTIAARGMTLAEFTRGTLTNFVDRPIVDHTGLSGRFDLQIEFALENRSGRGASADMPAETALPIFGALLQQLGLKLDSGKAPVEVLVIDRAERPSEN